MLEDSFCYEKEFPNNFISINGKRKRRNDHFFDYDSILSHSVTGRGKRIKKPINKYDHLDNLYNLEKRISNLNKRKIIKTENENIVDNFILKPFSPNDIFPLIDKRQVNEEAKKIENTTNELSMIYGKTYQELKVTDEDGKEEEIYVVDVTSDEELNDDKLNCNNFPSSRINNKSEIKNNKDINWYLCKDALNDKHFGHKDNNNGYLNHLSNSEMESSINLLNNYNGNDHFEINFNQDTFYKSLPILNSHNKRSLNACVNANNKLFNDIMFIKEADCNISSNALFNSNQISKLKKKSNSSKISFDQNIQCNQILNINNRKKIISKQTQDLSKYLNGPFIKVKNLNNLHVYQLVNSRDQDNLTSLTTFCALNIHESSSIFSSSKMTDCTPWKCIFCMHPSSFSFLGDLFGPYYLKSELNNHIANLNVNNHQKRKMNSSHVAATEFIERDWENSNQLPSEIWVHADCVVWTNGISVCGGSLHGLVDAATLALNLKCTLCYKRGATLGCYMKGCLNKYHFLCALHSDCLFDEEAFSIYCAKHKTRKRKSSQVLQKLLT